MQTVLQLLCECVLGSFSLNICPSDIVIHYVLWCQYTIFCGFGVPSFMVLVHHVLWSISVNTDHSFGFVVITSFKSMKTCHEHLRKRCHIILWDIYIEAINMNIIPFRILPITFTAMPSSLNFMFRVSHFLMKTKFCSYYIKNENEREQVENNHYSQYISTFPGLNKPHLKFLFISVTSVGEDIFIYTVAKECHLMG